VRLRNLIFVASVIAVITVVVWLGDNPTFRLFFAWPDGGTWSNTIAWLEDAFVASFFLWFFRDHIGKRLATWWQKHHAPHLQAQLDAHHDKMQTQLDEHRDKISRLLQDGSTVNGDDHDHDV
jgi:hypothetical protein